MSNLVGSYEILSSAGGIVIRGTIPTVARMGIEPIVDDLPAGKLGTLTRSEVNVGVATLSTGHGIHTGDIVDVHWAGGCRYNMTAEVSGNSVTLDGGIGTIDESGGDDLPATAATACVVTEPVSFDVTFDGDNLVQIGVGSNRQTNVRFVDANGATVGTPFLLVAGGGWAWTKDLQTPSPLAGNPVAAVKASNGSGALVAEFKMNGLQYPPTA
jgi:hypothetical protein